MSNRMYPCRANRAPQTMIDEARSRRIVSSHQHGIPMGHVLDSSASRTEVDFAIAFDQAQGN